MLRDYILTDSLNLIVDAYEVDLVDSLLDLISIGVDGTKIKLRLIDFMGKYNVSVEFYNVNLLSIELNMESENRLDSVEFSYKGYDSSIDKFNIGIDNDEIDVVIFTFTNGNYIRIGAMRSTAKVMQV